MQRLFGFAPMSVPVRRLRSMVAGVGLSFASLCAGLGLAPVAASAAGSAIYLPDCNGYGGPSSLICADPRPQLFGDEPFEDPDGKYIGHDEPGVNFYSTVPGSAFNVQWEIVLPTERTPNTNSGQSGGGPVQTFQNYPTFWFGLVLCDPNSNPGGACTGSSDNQPSANPGAAFLELQFYPPGQPSAISFTCGNQWCAALNIDSFTGNIGGNGSNGNPSCSEPVNASMVQKNGVPTGTPNGQTLLMSPGDRIRVAITDTAAGLLTVVVDETTHTTGYMVASKANGFFNTDPTTCATSPFAFHPLWSTATPAHNLPWGGLPNGVSFSLEIGHYDFVSGSPLACDNSATDGGSSNQSALSSTTSPSFTVCFDSFNVGDKDTDGFSYVQNAWPPSTNASSTALQIVSPLGHGLGPSTSNKLYSTMQFGTAQSTTTNGGFYPYYVLTTPDPYSPSFNCALLPGGFTSSNTDVTNTFGGTAQYTAGVIPNPCPN